MTMNKRVIHPALTEHDRLREKLTPGEKKVLDFFNEHLPVDWEIYMRHYMNGLRPDFVLLNPQRGIAVFEIRDWNFDVERYYSQKNKDYTDLWVEKNGEHSCINKENPVPKVNYYREEIFNLYCLRLQGRKKTETITAGIIFPFAEVDQIKNLLDPFFDNIYFHNENYARHQPISGIREITDGDIKAIFPEVSCDDPSLMTEEFANNLRGWLVEPDFSSTQRRPLLPVLNKKQRLLVENTDWDIGLHRIKGPAGSGKSLVLAARAARLATEGKSVLIVSFNITLGNYLRDFVIRGLIKDDVNVFEKFESIEFMHFHGWCKRVCIDVGWKKRYGNLWKHDYLKEYIFDVALPNLVKKALQQSGAKKYDAILVDEGQDYQPLWWNVLRNACNPNGGMLLVSDPTQDVYGTAKAWTSDIMKGAGFCGRWGQLNVSYRLPQNLLYLVQKFAKDFLPQETIENPIPKQGSLDFSHLRWVQCDPRNSANVCLKEIRSLMDQVEQTKMANVDIIMLASDKKSGAEVVNRLNNLNIQTVDTFDNNDDKCRQQKMGFYMENAKIKATTIHSFKGWESPMLVLYITKADIDEDLASLIYVGLTRLKRREEESWLTVVCCEPYFDDYGKNFPVYRPAY